MQIFCPYANPVKTAKCLDNRRLNKQILEAVQIISVNTNNFTILKQWKIIKPIGYKNRFKLYKSIKNHPITKMWKYTLYNFYLINYLFQLLKEYGKRKKKNHKCIKQYGILFNEIISMAFIPIKIKHLTPEFCKEHQQKLLDKNYEHYKKYFICKENKSIL